MNKPVYVCLLLLEIGKIVIYEFYYDNAKPNFGEKLKLCYIDTNSFVAYMKSEDIYSDIVKYVKIKFGTSNLELHRALP